MQPLSGNQRPGLLTCLVNMSLVLRLPREMHLCRSSSNAPRLRRSVKPSCFTHFWQGAQSASLPHKTTLRRPKVVRACGALTFLLANVLRATSPCTFWASQLPKVLRTTIFLKFWLRNAFRATMAFTFSTSQLPKVVRTWCVLRILTFEICFTPQRRKIFHLSSGQMAPHPPL